MKKITTMAMLAMMAFGASAAAPYTYSVGDLVTDEATGIVYKIAGENQIPNGDLTNGMTDWTVGSPAKAMTDVTNFTWHENGGPSDNPYIELTGAGGGGATDGSVNYTVPMAPGSYFVSFWYKAQGEWTRVTKTETAAGNDSYKIISNVPKGATEWTQATGFTTLAEPMVNINLAASWNGSGASLANYGVYPLEVTEESVPKLVELAAAKKAAALADIDNRVAADASSVWSTLTAESVTAAKAAAEAVNVSADVMTLAYFNSLDAQLAAAVNLLKYTNYTIKMEANSNYMASVSGKFRCQQELGENCYWQILPAGDDAYYLYNVVDQVYAYRSNGWDMDTTPNKPAAGNGKFKVSEKSEDLYYLIMSDTNQYVAADDPVNGANVWGNKSKDHADANNGRGVYTITLANFDPNDYQPRYEGLVEEIGAYTDAMVEADDAAFNFAMMGAEGMALQELYGNEEVTDYKAAYEALNDAFKTFKAAYPAFAAYYQLMQTATTGNYEYATEEKTAALTTAINTTYQEGQTAEEITAAAATLSTPLRAVVESNALAEGLEGTVNQTERIVNPNVAEGLTGWTQDALEGSAYSKKDLAVASGQPATLANGTELTNYWDKWDGSAWCDDFNQTISNVPAGSYRLSVFGRCSADGFETFALYANGEEANIPQKGNGGEVFGRGWNQVFVDFTLAEEGNVKLGVKINSLSGGNCWAGFCNFQLVNMPASVQDGVQAIEAADVEAVYYNLQGVRVANPENGLYIVRKGAKSYKVVK